MGVGAGSAHAPCPAAAAAAADEHHDREGDEREATRINTMRRVSRTDEVTSIGADWPEMPVIVADASGMFTTTFTDSESRTCWSNDAPIAFTSTCWPVRAATSSGSAPMPVWMAARSTSPVTS